MRAAGGASPQEHAYAQAYRDVTAHLSADEAFGRLRSAIESHCGLLSKQAQVRVRNWLKKLSEETANVVWKRNRNAYARLLLEQLRCGKLGEPFGAQPPGGPLPTLPKHLSYAFKRGGGSAVGGAAAGSPAAAESVQAGRQQPAVGPVPSQLQALLPLPPRQQEQQRQQQQQQASDLSASEQLDEYLGRADFRRAQFAEEEAPAAPIAAAWIPNAPPGPGASAAAPPAPPCLPGTRMQLRGAEGQRVDRHQLGDVGWQPSKLELEAALGASRERQAELEWRLAAMEGLVRQHAALLGPAADPFGPAAPLGSLLEAMDDGSLSPPRQRSGKHELEALIQRYEAKRRQWKAPAWAAGSSVAALPAPPAGSAGSSPRRRRAPPIEASDEEEILGQLDAFQRQTETIRRALAGGGSGGSADGGALEDRWAGASTSAIASDWGLPEATPARQHTTGLRGGGYTPHPGGGRGGELDLFGGLPLSPAALAATRGHANRHVQHAGHHWASSGPEQQPEQAAVQQPATVLASSRRGGAAAPPAEPQQQQQQQQQQRPRSPIGLEVRHTKKSAAAAAERASLATTSALQRLKSRRPGSAAAPAASETAPLAALSPPQQPALEQQQQAQQAQQQPSPEPPLAQWSGELSPAAAATAAASPLLPPQPPQLPPDSNAALVAEVRELRSRLLASLQKHAPELEAAGVQLSSSIGASKEGPLATALKQQRERRREEASQADRDSSPSSGSWRLAAIHAPAAASPAAASSSAQHLATDLPGGWQTAAAPGALSSSSKFRLTTDDGGGLGPYGAGNGGRLTDLGSSLKSFLGGGGGGGRLTDLGSSFGQAGAQGSSSLARLGSLEFGSSGSPLAAAAAAASPFSLEAFEAQTEALARRLERM